MNESKENNLKNQKIEKYALIQWKECLWLQPKNFKSRLKSDIEKLKRYSKAQLFQTPFNP